MGELLGFHEFDSQWAKLKSCYVVGRRKDGRGVVCEKIGREAKKKLEHWSGEERFFNKNLKMWTGNGVRLRLAQLCQKVTVLYVS